MNRFWKPILEPLLTALDPRVIAEVGCAQGDHTRHLAGFATRHQCDLHVIDPAPELDPDELRLWQAKPGFGFQLHRALSLDVLPRLSRIDVAFLDGDHNWHTVYHELKALEEASRRGPGPMPLVVLHDMGWPYGRRDMYYGPAAIPESGRQPIGQGGISPGFHGQTGAQGFNVGVSQATREGGERNGVLTAVEDYLLDSELEFAFTIIPLFHGLGILCPTPLLAVNTALGAFWKDLDRHIARGGLLEAVEQERVQLGIDLTDLRRIMEAGFGWMEHQKPEEDLLIPMEKALAILFASKRWRIGNLVVDGLRSLIGGGDGPGPVEAIQEILARGRERRERRVVVPPPTALPAPPRVMTPPPPTAIMNPDLKPIRTEQEVIQDFHQLYYRQEDQTWRRTFWMGVPVLKCPLDLWIYQEIVHEVRPDLIIETGTYNGGSALYLASLCDQLRHGRILTIDVSPQENLPSHRRIEYLKASSVDPDLLRHVEGRAEKAKRVLVILDSDHRAEHVLAELRAYAAFVSQGGYLIVEDTNVNGHPVMAEHGPGPREALGTFLEENHDFLPDRARERFFMTFNPGGYLRRVTARPQLRKGRSSFLTRWRRQWTPAAAVQV